MAKHNGITIRIGAAHDQVEVHNNGRTVVYDRSEMRKAGKPELQGVLRRTAVEVWNDQRAAAKGKRNNRRSNQARDKARRD